jgi:hypothetical protein
LKHIHIPIIFVSQTRLIKTPFALFPIVLHGGMNGAVINGRTMKPVRVDKADWQIKCGNWLRPFWMPGDRRFVPVTTRLTCSVVLLQVILFTCAKLKLQAWKNPSAAEISPPGF